MSSEEEPDRMSSMPTEELPWQQSTGGRPVAPEPPTTPIPTGRARVDRPRRSVLSGFAGVLVCVLVLLACGLIVAQLVSGNQGNPGPGVVTVGAHLLGAVLGVLLYRQVTRRTDALRVVAVLGLLVITGVLTWLFWWTA